MPNPFNMMNNMGGNTNLPQINQDMMNLVNMLKNSGNPTQMLQAMIGQNPQMQPLINMLKRGATPEQLVRQICRERNINVDEFMSQFR